MIKIFILTLIGGLGRSASGDHWNKPVTYIIPEDRSLKINLGYVEDAYLNFTELTNKYRYRSEQHTVTTEDGYILTLFRLLPKCNEMRNYPVILMHGVFDSSDAWILPGPKKSLGYALSDNCYDVWAANHRGNRYSRSHVRLDPNTSAEYWDFSFDEHGNYDVPAIIDYVLAATQRPQAHYVGHSQGTTIFFAMNSLKPEYNDKIRLSLHLAPVAWLKHTRNPLAKAAASHVNLIKQILDGVGIKELLARHQLTHVILELLCQIQPDLVCGTGLTLMTGYTQGSISPKTLSVVFGHLLVGVSLKTLIHFAQLINSKKFQQYDEGIKGNIKKYGSTTPPEYNISRTSSPVVLVCGQTDWLSNLKDVREISSRLPNLLEEYVVPEVSWSHNDHIWGVKAPTYVFKKVLNYIDRFDT